jgi:hypothetical protein
MSSGKLYGVLVAANVRLAAAGVICANDATSSCNSSLTRGSVVATARFDGTNASSND